MSKEQKLYLMGVVGFWGALVYAIGWRLIDWLTQVPSAYNVTIGSFSITVNRWFDVLLFPLYLNLILSVYLYLAPFLEKRGIKHEDLVVGLGVGLGAGLFAELVVGLGYLVKGIIELHKRAFQRLEK